MMRWSAVSRRNRWTRAVATITRSPGSRNASPSAATSKAISVVRGMMRNAGLVSNARNTSSSLKLSRCFPSLRNASSSRLIALTPTHSLRLSMSSRMRHCSRESFLDSYNQRTTMWVSSRNRGCNYSASSSRRSASHKCAVVKLTISPTILPWPAKRFLGDFHTGFFAAETVATGRPRLVTVIVPPCSSISSSSARHFALNSVAPMTRDCIYSAYIECGHLTSRPALPHALRGVVARSSA
jgi:hypothetical protein